VYRNYTQKQNKQAIGASGPSCFSVGKWLLISAEREYMCQARARQDAKTRCRARQEKLERQRCATIQTKGKIRMIC